MNIALRGRVNRWAMNEHPRSTVARAEDRFAVGDSRLAWEGDTLAIQLNERTAPFPGWIRGSLRVRPEAFNRRAFALDLAGRHRWWPIAPFATVEATFEEPRLRFSGRAYLDSNWGKEPLEHGFAGWNWSRSDLKDRTVVHYITDELDGGRRARAFDFDRSGDAIDRDPLSPMVLPKTGWRVAREAVADPGTQPEVIEGLEDTPFYSRQRIRHRVDGEWVEAIHESLDLKRFDRRWVQTLLPFKTKRF
ncbi:MAG: hydratase [Myxococcota bacterium]